jgi:hypothetical protein
MTNQYVQEFTVREIAPDIYSFRIHREDPDLDLSDIELFLDYQQMIRLLDTVRSALK